MINSFTCVDETLLTPEEESYDVKKKMLKVFGTFPDCSKDEGCFARWISLNLPTFRDSYKSGEIIFLFFPPLTKAPKRFPCT